MKKSFVKTLTESQKPESVILISKYLADKNIGEREPYQVVPYTLTV